LTFNMQLQGLDNNGWNLIELDYITQTTVECSDLENRDNKCYSENILAVPHIEYPYYRLRFELTSQICAPGTCPKDWMRDVQFSSYSITQPYTRFVLGFKSTYCILACLLFLVFFFKTQKSLENRWY